MEAGVAEAPQPDPNLDSDKDGVPDRIDACPKDVRPTDSIVGLRKRLIKYKMKKVFGMVKDED